MDRDHGSQQKGIVLKFQKRRFDGGSEVALIKAFERQEARMRSRMLIRTEPLTIMQAGNPLSGGFAENRLENQEKPPLISEKPKIEADEPILSDNPFIEALFLGPLELCVGLLGVFTATLGIMTFSHLKNDMLSRQSRDVLRDCFRTIGKGMRDTVAGPGKAVKLVFGRA